MKAIDSFLNKLDTFQRTRRFVRFGFAVIKKHGEDEAGYQAALMTYYGFLSLFPLLLVLTTLVKVMLGSNTALRDKIINGVTNYFPFISSELQDSVHGLGGNGLALVAGLLGTIYGARGVADVLRHTINHVWEVPRVERPGFPASLFKSLQIIIVAGFGLVLVPVISGYLSAVGHGPLVWLLSGVLTLSLLFGIFLFLIQTSLPKRQPFNAIWPSSFAAAVGLGILQSFGGFLLTKQLKHLDSLYGTFALVLGLLFWMYLQAQVIIYALEAGSVRALGLYPRSLLQDNLTPADNKAFRLYANRNHLHNSVATQQTTHAPTSDKTN